jgi:hypothetical protein
MITCDYCKKKINKQLEVYHLEITRWYSDGNGDGTGNIGDYHEDCAKEVVKKLKKIAKEMKK